MTSPNQRTAATSLDAARQAGSRLDAARDPEDNAADILDAWSAAETSLRALLGGSAQTGQKLVLELRQRQHLSYEQANALVEFQAARDRSNRPSYQPNAGDVDAVRRGLAVLDTVVLGGGAAANAPTAIIAPPVASAASAASSASSAASVPPDFGSPVPPRPSGSTWRQGSSAMIVGGLLVLLLALGGGAVWFAMSRGGGGGGGGGGGSAEDRGVEAYAQGRREAARGEFEKAAKDDPGRAIPHIYLGRIARDEGDAAGAQRELETAIRLEPGNYLAHREMASHLLAAGKPDLARSFYVRALGLNANDRTSQGFLGCALVRMGRYDEARRWLDRAGSGDWSSCAQQIPPASSAPAAPRP